MAVLLLLSAADDAPEVVAAVGRPAGPKPQHEDVHTVDTIVE
jgi:hypothetical protein